MKKKPEERVDSGKLVFLRFSDILGQGRCFSFACCQHVEMCR
jgi:hypothetical protein